MPLADLQAIVRSPIRDVRGPGATEYPIKVPHLTVGYTYGECDSDQVQRMLRNQVRPVRASMGVNAVHLVDVIADAQAGTITWEHIARIPLGEGN